MLATATAERRHYTMAVDYGDGFERQFTWSCSEMEARRHFVARSRTYRTYGPCALLDGTAHVLATADAWGSGR